MTMNGTVAFWIRIGLLAISGGAANAGLSIYDPATDTITIQVESLASIFGAVGSFLVWGVWHRITKNTGGVT